MVCTYNCLGNDAQHLSNVYIFLLKQNNRKTLIQSKTKSVMYLLNCNFTFLFSKDVFLRNSCKIVCKHSLNTLPSLSVYPKAPIRITGVCRGENAYHQSM